MNIALLLMIPLGMLFVAEAGYRLGRRSRLRDDAAAVNQIESWQTAVLGLLGLLMGFTFAMAVSRFDTRKQLILSESNAIGTAHLRARLLDPRIGAPLGELLRQYTEVRLAFYRAGADPERVNADLRESAALQERMWSLVTQAAQAQPTPITALMVTSMNELIDLDAARVEALLNHVPVAIFVVLGTIAAAAIGAIGYTCGLRVRRLLFGTVTIPLLLSAVMIMLIDLDRPRQGLIRAGQRSMERLRTSL